MKNVCNSCGREFDESVKMYSHTAENGTSYLLCEECETNGVEVAANAGVRAIIAPAGSLRDADVIARANELGVALYYAPERIFSHH